MNDGVLKRILDNGFEGMIYRRQELVPKAGTLQLVPGVRVFDVCCGSRPKNRCGHSDLP